MEANFEEAKESAKKDKYVTAGQTPLKAKGFLFGEVSGAAKPYTVCILFSPEVAPHFVRVEWFYDQHLIVHENGAVELHFDTHSLDGLDAWILGWGTAVTALKPQELRTMIVEAAEAVLKQHTGEPDESALTAEDL
jgi:hypothetical protein